MRIDVIINAAAGSVRQYRSKALVRGVGEAFMGRGHRVGVTLEKGKSLGRAIRRSCDDPSVEVVVIGGGDGSVSRALEHVVPAGKSLGILPMGTMNYVARELGTPRDPVQAAAALADGRVSAIDLGEVNGRMFLIRACLGMLPEFIRGRDLVRRKGGEVLNAVAAGLLGVVRNYPLIDVALRWDGGARRLSTPFLMISNNVCVDTAPLRLRRRRLDEATLAVYLANGIDPASLATFGIQAMMGQWINNNELAWFTTRGIEVDAPGALELSIDGEVETMKPPLAFITRPLALKILCPTRAAT
jgi:diacylglycerol kinase family enzyme